MTNQLPSIQEEADEGEGNRCLKTDGTKRQEFEEEVGPRSAGSSSTIIHAARAEPELEMEL